MVWSFLRNGFIYCVLLAYYYISILFTFILLLTTFLIKQYYRHNKHIKTGSRIDFFNLLPL